MDIELQYFLTGYVFCMIADGILALTTLLLEKAREIRQRRKNGN